MKHYSTPDEANAIAEHTARVLASMRQQRTVTDLKSIAGAWHVWADANHVCRQIRSLMVTAEVEIGSNIKANSPAPVIRNPAGADA